MVQYSPPTSPGAGDQTEAPNNVAIRAKLEIDRSDYEIAHLTPYGFTLSGSTNLKARQVLPASLRFGENEVSVDIQMNPGDEQPKRGRFCNLSLKAKNDLKSYLQRVQEQGRSDRLNAMSYDEIANGQKSAGQKNAAPKGATKSKRFQTMVAGGMAVAIVGILLLVIVFIHVRSNVSVANAALVGNFLPVNSTVDGLIDEVMFDVNHPVKKGDVLFRVRNEEIEQEVALLEAQLESAAAQLQAYRKLVAEHQTKVQIVAETLDRQLSIAQAEFKMVQAVVDAAEKDMERVGALVRRKAVSGVRYDEAKARVESVVAERDAKKAKLEMLDIAKKAAVERGIIMLGEEIDDDLAEFRAQLEIAEARTKELEQSLEAGRTKARQMEVRAPRDAHIYATYCRSGEFVSAAAPVLSLSLSSGYWAAGTVSSDAVHLIRPGQVVDVRAPSLKLKLRGRVEAVGHRAVYTGGDWAQDFRGEALSVPIKVSLPKLSHQIPSGIRLKMVVQTRSDWSEEDEAANASATIASNLQP